MTKKSTRLGKTPKVTLSANESRSLPIFELDFKALAANPSKKSAIPAIINKYSTSSMDSKPWIESEKMAKTPHAKLQQVRKFGKLFLNQFMKVQNYYLLAICLFRFSEIQKMGSFQRNYSILP
jgi:hypothetical protein